MRAKRVLSEAEGNRAESSPSVCAGIEPQLDETPDHDRYALDSAMLIEITRISDCGTERS